MVQLKELEMGQIGQPEPEHWTVTEPEGEPPRYEPAREPATPATPEPNEAPVKEPVPA